MDILWDLIWGLIKLLAPWALGFFAIVFISVLLGDDGSSSSSGSSSGGRSSSNDDDYSSFGNVVQGAIGFALIQEAENREAQVIQENEKLRQEQIEKDGYYRDFGI
ncbi:MAG: hypothetical protein FWE80_05080 [Oscillospiraceae bacterium]|nr:hypothetical protein [Oscillospiraceae bacterium]